MSTTLGFRLERMSIGYSTKGSHNKGTRIIVSKKSINIKLIEKVIHCKSLAWRLAIPFLSEGKSLLDRVI